MHAEAWSLDSVGLDWLNGTHPMNNAGWKVLYTVKELVQMEAERGNDIRPFKLQGYRGQTSGGVAWGRREDSVFVQLRSDAALTYGLGMIPTLKNVSRLDLQVTARRESVDLLFVRRNYRRALRHRGGRGRRIGARYVEDLARGSTCYLGSRQSECYARLYDKGAEKRTAPLGTLFRWELQTREDLSKSLAREIVTDSNPPLKIHSHVLSRFSALGVEAPGEFFKVEQSPRGRERTDEARRLAYLYNVVRPMIGTMKGKVDTGSILRVLGLDDVAEALHSEPLDRKDSTNGIE